LDVLRRRVRVSLAAGGSKVFPATEVTWAVPPPGSAPAEPEPEPEPEEPGEPTA
jgi:hypothetical protein